MNVLIDEQERIERRRHIRLIITEVLMSLSVLFLIGFLTLVVMGYTFNLREIGGSGEVVERSGLVQVSSLPTGATIYIDGETSLLFATNASRTVLAGEHEISLAKGGFDGWKKTINVTEGMMYRLNYPRLFKEEREVETALEFLETDKVELATVSPNNEKMAILLNGQLYIVNLNDNAPEMKKLEILDDSSNVVKITTLSPVAWSGNSEKMLAETEEGWVIINTRNAKETVWLSKLLEAEKATVRDIKFESEAGDRLLILTGEKELREFNVRDKKLSEALVSGVEKFDNDGERVAYLTREISEEVRETSGAEATLTGVRLDTVVGEARAYRVGEENSFLISRIYGDVDYKITEFRIATMRYFQESYVAIASKRGSSLLIYKKNGWVNADGDMEEFYFGGRTIASKALEKRGKGMVFESVGTDGMRSVFDIEAVGETVIEKREGEEGWIDEYLRYNISEAGALSVRDYDGLNGRELVPSGVLSGRTVAISGNNRYLYYFVKDSETGAEKLVRERIV